MSNRTGAHQASTVLKLKLTEALTTVKVYFVVLSWPVPGQIKNVQGAEAKQKG